MFHAGNPFAFDALAWSGAFDRFGLEHTDF